MADHAKPASTTDYSASQAPETQDSARHEPEHDYRAIPGGDPARSTRAVGMESFDADAWPRPGANAIHSPDAQANRHPHGRR